MKSLLLAQLVVGLVLASSIDAEAGIIRGRRYPLDFDVAPRPHVDNRPLVEERIPNDSLPEDGGKCYLTVFTSPNPEGNPKERILLDNLRTNARLQNIAGQTHFHHIKSDDPMFAGRYLATVGNVMPVVILQEPKAFVDPIFRRSGTTVPDDGDVLAEAMEKSIREWVAVHGTTKLVLSPTLEPVTPALLQPAVYQATSDELKGARPFRPKPHPDNTPCPDCTPKTPPAANVGVGVQVVPPDVGDVEEEEEGGSVDMMTLGVVAGVIVFLVAGVLVFLGKSGVFG